MGAQLQKPWTCSNEGDGDGYATVRDLNGEEVCRIQIFHFCPSGDGQIVDNEQYDQSRAMILAAPLMIEALRAARDLWGDYLPPGNSNAMKAMKLVNAAIAKVECES